MRRFEVKGILSALHKLVLQRCQELQTLQIEQLAAAQREVAMKAAEAGECCGASLQKGASDAE